MASPHSGHGPASREVITTRGPADESGDPSMCPLGSLASAWTAVVRACSHRATGSPRVRTATGFADTPPNRRSSWRFPMLGQPRTSAFSPSTPHEEPAAVIPQPASLPWFMPLPPTMARSPRVRCSSRSGPMARKLREDAHGTLRIAGDGARKIHRSGRFGKEMQVIRWPSITGSSEQGAKILSLLRRASRTCSSSPPP